MIKLKLQSVIVALVFIVLDHYIYGQDNFGIYRGNHDTFNNQTCLKYGRCNNCTAMNAYCIRGDTHSSCLECRCFGQYKTYLRYFGKCVRDNRLLFFPGKTVLTYATCKPCAYACDVSRPISDLTKLICEEENVPTNHTMHALTVSRFNMHLNYKSVHSHAQRHRLELTISQSNSAPVSFRFAAPVSY